MKSCRRFDHFADLALAETENGFVEGRRQLLLGQPADVASFGGSGIRRFLFSQLSKIFSASGFCDDAIRARLGIAFLFRVCRSAYENIADFDFLGLMKFRFTVG